MPVSAEEDAAAAQVHQDRSTVSPTWPTTGLAAKSANAASANAQTAIVADS